MDKKAFVTEANLRDRKNPEGLRFPDGIFIFIQVLTELNSRQNGKTT